MLLCVVIAMASLLPSTTDATPHTPAARQPVRSQSRFPERAQDGVTPRVAHLVALRADA